MKATTVILANGDFPKKGGAAWRLLAEARHVVCCDGAAVAYRRRFRAWPTVIVGDLDSLSDVAFGRAENASVCVHDPDQETNDLEKAIAYCASRGWKRPVIVGASGKREDHMIGNVFRALAAGLTVVTDAGVFEPVCGCRTFRVRKDAGVSIFAPDPMTRMTSRGLRWPLDGVCFDSLYRATLNRTSAPTFTVTSDRPVLVYIESRPLPSSP